MNIKYVFRMILTKLGVGSSAESEILEAQELHMKHDDSWYENIIKDWNNAGWYAVTKLAENSYAICPTPKHTQKDIVTFGLDRDLSEIGGTLWQQVGGIKRKPLTDDPHCVMLVWQSEQDLTQLEKIFVQYLEKWSHQNI